MNKQTLMSIIRDKDREINKLEHMLEASGDAQYHFAKAMVEKDKIIKALQSKLDSAEAATEISFYNHRDADQDTERQRKVGAKLEAGPWY